MRDPLATLSVAVLLLGACAYLRSSAVSNTKTWLNYLPHNSGLPCMRAGSVFLAAGKVTLGARGRWEAQFFEKGAGEGPANRRTGGDVVPSTSSVTVQCGKFGCDGCIRSLFWISGQTLRAASANVASMPMLPLEPPGLSCLRALMPHLGGTFFKVIASQRPAPPPLPTNR